MNQEFTQLLDQVGAGDERAREMLVERVYERLRAMAGRQLRGSNSHSLHATALVHEAYEKLFGSDRPSFEGRNRNLGTRCSAG